MIRSRKPKLPNPMRAVARSRLVLAGLARWLLSLAERLATDPDETESVDRVRVYVDELIVGNAGEPPLDDIALVVGLIGSAIELPPDDPDGGPDAAPSFAVRGRRTHTLSTGRGLVRTPSQSVSACALACAY
jgi:hypothetical protein